MSQSFDNPDKDHCTKQRDQKTVNVKTAYSFFAEKVHNPAAQRGTNDTEDDINQ